MPNAHRADRAAASATNTDGINNGLMRTANDEEGAEQEKNYEH